MKGLTTKRSRRRGFTLMEVLIVLAILVALAALVVPRLLSVGGKADIKNTKTQIGGFAKALDLYYLDCKGFPTEEQGLQALMEEPAASEEGAGVKNWDGPYLEAPELPNDPWGNEYQYKYPPVNNTRDFPDIWSWGPDGEDGTEDDIVNWKTTGTEGEEGDFGGDEEFSEPVDKSPAE